jgi:hypothetical protein
MKLLSKKVLYPLRAATKRSFTYFYLTDTQTLKNKYNMKKNLAFLVVLISVPTFAQNFVKPKIERLRTFSHLKLATRYQLFYQKISLKNDK